MPQIQVVSIPSSLSSKVLSDTFMGNTFQSLSATAHNLVLLSSINFEVDSNLEIGSSYSLEVPSTSSLEIKAYVQHGELLNVNYNEPNFVEDGCFLAGTTTSTCTLTYGHVWINGQRVYVAAQSLSGVGSSNDSYVYVNQAGTVTVVTAAANNSPPPISDAAANNAVLLGIIVTSSTTVSSFNQGQMGTTAPTYSTNQTIEVCDGNGNLIRPTARQTLLAFRRLTANTGVGAVGTSPTQINQLVANVLVPANRKVRITANVGGMNTSTGNNNMFLDLWENGVNSGTQIAMAQIVSTTANFNWSAVASAYRTPNSLQWPGQGSNFAFAGVTYAVAIHTAGGLTPQVIAGSTQPAWLAVELV
jgi:hypothetical protein